MVDFRIVRVQIQDSVPSRRGHLPDHPAPSGLWPAGDLKHCKALQFITALEAAPFTAQIRKSVWFSCQPLPYHPLGPQSRLQLRLSKGSRNTT